MYRALSIGIAAVAAVILLLGQGPRPVEAATTVYVTSNADSGSGTFRAAVDQANSNSDVNRIQFLVGGPINLQTPTVRYEGDQALTLAGRLTGTILDGSNVCDDTGLFLSSDGAPITLQNLTFRNTGCGANGVTIVVENDDPPTTITLTNVQLRNNSRNGLAVAEPADTCDDSDTSIVVNITNTIASGNGLNGILVDEDGDGDLTTSVRFSQFRDNGEDGLLLEENCDGDLDVTTLATTFNGNGADGLDMEEWGDGTATAALSALEASRNGDDGVDFDETDEELDPESVGTTDASEGDEAPAEDSGPEAATCSDDDDLTLTITGGVANENGDGLDIDEQGCGRLYATFTTLVANGNDDDGVDMIENGGGDVVVRASATQTSNNGRDDEEDDGNGFQVYENGYGSADIELSGFTANNNGRVGGSSDGIEIEESYYGSVYLTVQAGTILTNLDDGVDVEEDDCGDLEASFTLSGVNLNAESGFDLEQNDCGSDFGELTLTTTTVLGNGDGSFEFDGVVLN